jgi:antitoxin FitA
MAEVRVRKLDDWVVSALRLRAKRHGRSLEGELRELLSEEALRPRIEAADRAQAMREAILSDNGSLPDSAALIREDRDARG